MLSADHVLSPKGVKSSFSEGDLGSMSQCPLHQIMPLLYWKSFSGFPIEQNHSKSFSELRPINNLATDYFYILSQKYPPHLFGFSLTSFCSPLDMPIIVPLQVLSISSTLCLERFLSIYHMTWSFTLSSRIGNFSLKGLIINMCHMVFIATTQSVTKTQKQK